VFVSKRYRWTPNRSNPTHMNKLVRCMSVNQLRSLMVAGELPHKHNVPHSNDRLQLYNCWNTSDPCPPGALHAVYAFLNVSMRPSPLQVTLPQKIAPLDLPRAGKCRTLEVGSGWQASKPDTKKPQGHAMITDSQGEPGYRGSQSQLCDETLKTVAPLTLSSADEDAQVKWSCVAGQTAPETLTEFAMMIERLYGVRNSYSVVLPRRISCILDTCRFCRAVC
jgi:hypothetical protein